MGRTEKKEKLTERELKEEKRCMVLAGTFDPGAVVRLLGNGELCKKACPWEKDSNHWEKGTAGGNKTTGLEWGNGNIMERKFERSAPKVPHRKGGEEVEE